MGAKAKTKAARNGTRDAVVVPDKLYFRIGEVARLCDVPTYVLRFWQTEFPQLAPKKSSTGQRLFRRKDVEMALRIKQLLYEEGFTIAGARQQLRIDSRPGKNQQGLPFLVSAPDGNKLKQVRAGLQEILTTLSRSARKR